MSSKLNAVVITDELGPYCYLCDKEELPTSPTEDELVYPACCLHRNAGCRTCLLQWMYTCKNTLRAFTCPFCRSPFCMDDFLTILDIDETMYEWMRQNRHVMCVACGFFYICTVVGGRTCRICGEVPVKDSYGRVNIRYTIRRTQVRRERQDLRDQQYQECMDPNSYYRNATAWLFLPDGADRKLHQLSCQEERRKRRNRVNKECWEQTLHAAWLFLRRGADIRAMHHLVMKEDFGVREIQLKRKMDLDRQRKELKRRQQEHERWLLRCQEEWSRQQTKHQQEEMERKKHFALTKERSHLNFLAYQEQQQEWKQRISMGTRRIAVHLEREKRRNDNATAQNPAWLFLQSKADVQAMKQLFVRDDVNKFRQDSRRETTNEYEFQNDASKMFPEFWKSNCWDCFYRTQRCRGINTCNEDAYWEEWTREILWYEYAVWEKGVNEICEDDPKYSTKWMTQRGKSAKNSRRRGMKSSKNSMSKPKESTTKRNARWKRKQDNLSWSQDENSFHLSSVSYPRSIVC